MTTSVTNIADASRDYLWRLLAYLEANNESSEKIKKTDFELETLSVVIELAVGQALLWLEEAEKLDMLLHQYADDMSEGAWIESDKANQQLFEMIIHFGKAVLTICERLRKQDLTVEKHEQLTTCVAKFERNMNWSINDYANSPAFQEFMKAALEEYKAGEVEEGGWQL